jgi:tetratricopeptide (TPR) repeat protein
MSIPLNLLLRRALLILALLSLAPALPADEDEVDHLALASLLVRDGKYDRASTEYAKVDPAQEDLDLIQYHTVGGLIALNRQEPARAITAFEAAVAAGQTEPSIYLYLAQAQFTLERYADVIRTLDRAGAAIEAMPAVWLMRAQAHWLQQQRQRALDVLAEGAARFPANLSFPRRQVFFLIELGYYQAASDLGSRYLAKATDAKEEDYLAIGSALRRAKQPDAAIRFLEAARLRFGPGENLTKQLAAVWLDRGMPLVAAELMHGAAQQNPALLPEAAELFRRAKQPQRALLLNAGISDQRVKLKQRVGLLLELGRYAEVLAMETALTRTGLIAEEEIRYAVAFSNYRNGDFEATERHLQKLTKPDLFRKATELRKLMSDCAEQRWQCA